MAPLFRRSAAAGLPASTATESLFNELWLPSVGEETIVEST